MRSFFLTLLGLVSLSAAQDLGLGTSKDVLYVHHFPDPVNVRTGNFSLPVQDYYLPCFAFPLEIYRSYNSFSTRNSYFGKGWLLNYDVQIVVDESQGMRVVEADGFVNEFDPVENDVGDKSKEIEKIVDLKKKEDAKYSGSAEGKGQTFYDSFRKRLENEDDFLNRQRARYLPKTSKISKSGKYVSRKRGTLYLEKTVTGYSRTAETGRVEEYNTKGLLVRVSDRNDNEMNFSYDSKSRISKISDMCGQTLNLTYDSRDKITSIRDSLGRSLAYEYDNQDHLVKSIALDGDKTSYVYDKADHMTKIQFPDNTSVDITYDPKTGNVTKQSGPGKKVSTFNYGKDGGTRWATIQEEDGSKVRYEYNDAENKVVFIDKSGKKTITALTACCGKPLSIKDEKGIGEEFQYDAQGNLSKKIDAQKQVTTFKYETRFNLHSEIKMHDGSTLRFLYDGHGNLTFLSSSTGEHAKVTYESHGKIEQMTNEKDQSIRYKYNEVGKPTLVQKYDKNQLKGSIRVAYDKTGEISNVEFDPKNPETIQDIKETMGTFMRFLKPTGYDFEI